jgi:hypothetical protein
MKKALTVFGGIFLILLGAGGCMFGYAAFKGRKLDAEGKVYIEATLPKILANPGT